MNTLEENLKDYVKQICNETIKNGPQEMEFTTFPQFLKTHRVNKTSFGEIIGVTGSTITKYIDEPGNLKVSQVVKLADATKVDVRYLIKLIIE